MLSEVNVYVNVTYVSVVLKMNMNKMLSELNVYVNVKYVTHVLKIKMKKVE
jgi:hypothetical protein